MGSSFIPEGYQPHLSLYQTQSAISLIKRVFQDSLAHALHLRQVLVRHLRDGDGANCHLLPAHQAEEQVEGAGEGPRVNPVRHARTPPARP